MAVLSICRILKLPADNGSEETQSKRLREVDETDE
jgi:hypothetical protein